MGTSTESVVAPAPGGKRSTASTSAGRPATERVSTLRSSQSSTHSAIRGRIEPFRETLRTVLLTAGLLGLACFVAPWSFSQSTPRFAWTEVVQGRGPSLLAVLFLASSICAIIFGVVTMKNTARSLAAFCIGLGSLIALGFDGRNVNQTPWIFIAQAVICAGLLLRAEYSLLMVPRILITVGVSALVAIAFLLPPQIRSISAVLAFDNLSETRSLLTVLLSALALTAWLPISKSVFFRSLAAFLILLPAVSLSILSVLQGGALADIAGKFLFPVGLSCWLCIMAYGCAALLAKGLEPRREP